MVFLHQIIEQRVAIAVAFATMLACLPTPAIAQEQPAAAPLAPETTSAEETRPSLVELSNDAARLLSAGEISDEVLARQQAIVDALQTLLGGAKSATAQLPQAVPQGVPSQRPSAQSGQNSPVAGTTQSPDGGGERRTDGAESSQADRGDVPAVDGPLLQREGLADAVWGQLPPRMRDELYRSYTERFVPQYSPQLRRYFEKLAESAPPRRAKSAD